MTIASRKNGSGAALRLPSTGCTVVLHVTFVAAGVADQGSAGCADADAARA